ncbi:MAG: AAA family ATPase [Erysipelotrichaceae bacterium]|nr:AAA family ATPase [Erysipelotrichaceae bacterium]
MGKFSWVDFYKELTDKLLAFRGRGRELVAKVAQVYDYANANGASIKNNMTVSQLTEKGVTNLNEVDPVTVLGVINRELLFEKRVKLCEGFKEVFEISATVPTDFEAVPTFDNRNAWIIAQNYDVWNLVEAAIKYADTGEGKDEFIKAFNVIQSRKSMGYLTFGLFWIRPMTYVACDANAIHYIADTYPDLAPLVKTNKPTAEQYLALCESLQEKYKSSNNETDNLELSYNAFVYSKAFVFQCNPKAYDIIGAVRNLDKMVYAVKVLKREVVIGSRVYIWMSGKNGGVVAKAKVISEVGKHDDPEGDAYYLEGNGSGDSENVWIEFTDRMCDNIISKELINSVSGMENFGFNQGTNFKISMEQAKILDDLIEGKDVAEISGLDKKSDDEWYPSLEEYNSGITKEKWLEILPDLLNRGWGSVMAMFHTEKDGATCKQIAKKFNTDHNSVRSRCVQMAKRVHDITSCPILTEGSNNMYWVILFQGKNVITEDEGSYIWKLRPELHEALSELNVSQWLPKEGVVPFEEDDRTSYYLYDSIEQSGKNIVVYGTPGCGKSFYVKTETERECQDENIVRTTFYPDYTNTDFIGQILPRVTNKNVTYEFKPGPFTLALEKALKHPEEKVALVIEELNRGNAASIFGEMFQLLDRDKDGVHLGRSTYSVVNVHMQDYLNDRLAAEGVVLDRIMIPGNMSIYATMNTSDQNVFTLDTAFKRRWKYKKLPNKFENDHKYKDYLVPGMGNISWQRFVASINDRIVSSMNSLMAEDKQLGVYFAEEELLNRTPEDNTEEKVREFAYKIFEYLWDDVAKYNRQQWFRSVKTLDALLDLYEELAKENRGAEVFNDGIIK